MKIQINYDLLNKIAEAKCGFSLVKIAKKGLIFGTVATIGAATYNLSHSAPLLEYVDDAMFMYISQVFIHSTIEFILAKKSKDFAATDIKWLLSALKSIKVPTTEEQLMNAYKYDTEYKLVRSEDSSRPSVVQKKYIMVPIYDNGEEKEISVVQEHIIGTDEYSLSRGEPNKVRKLVLNRNPI